MTLDLAGEFIQGDGATWLGAVALFARLVAHIRQHRIAFLALFFSLGGTSWAVSNGPPFVRGGGEIRTGAVEVGAMPWPEEFPSPEPVLLKLPHFGELFVAACQHYTEGSFQTVRGLVRYRNTTDHPVELPLHEPDVVQPGATHPDTVGDTDGFSREQWAYRTAAKHAGRMQTRARVATLFISGVGDLNTNTCRLQAQATIQIAKDG